MARSLHFAMRSHRAVVMISSSSWPSVVCSESKVRSTAVPTRCTLILHVAKCSTHTLTSYH
jgi:hypothetical protein